MVQESVVVLPGDFITKHDSKNRSGDQTHVHNGNIIASVMGKVKKSDLHDGMISFSVEPRKPPGLVPTSGAVVIAKVTSITRRVVRCDIVAVGDKCLAGPFRGLIRREDIRATQRDQAEPSECYRPGDLIRARVINLIGPSVITHGDSADAFSTASFPSSTLLAARAISCSVGVTNDANIGNLNAVCLLSTAEPDLGVVLGLGRSPDTGFVELLGCTSGSPLIPISWGEMLCPHTLTRHPRKVARVPDELLSQLVCTQLN